MVEDILTVAALRGSKFENQHEGEQHSLLASLAHQVSFAWN